MRLTLTMFLTLDGIYRRLGEIGEDRSGGFEHGGWQVPYVDQDFMRIVTTWFDNADAFLFGRRTYEIFAGYWPRVTDPNNVIAAKLNAQPKYVASRTLKELDWDNATLLMSDVVAEVKKLKEQEGRELQIHGCGELAQVLMVNNLIDEYRLCIHPVVLSNCRRVFLEGALSSRLHLLEGRTTSTGVTMHSHNISGTPAFGDFTIDDLGAGAKKATAEPSLTRRTRRVSAVRRSDDDAGTHEAAAGASGSRHSSGRRRGSHLRVTA